MDQQNYYRLIKIIRSAIAKIKSGKAAGSSGVMFDILKVSGKKRQSG